MPSARASLEQVEGAVEISLADTVKRSRWKKMFFCIGKSMRERTW